MSDTISRGDLLALRAEYDYKLSALQAEVATLRRRPRRQRRPFLPLLLAALLVALVPLATLAANPFNDLNPGSVHNANIDAIFNAGITKGCDPGVSYCPNNFVTREEMASFLARTAGLGANPPVANAAQLGGQPASAYQLAGQPVASAAIAQKLMTSPVSASAYAANDLVRTARAVSTYTRDQDPATPDTELVVSKVLNIDSAFDPIAVVTLNAPASGFIIVAATVGLSIEGTGTVGLVRLRDTGATTANTSPLLSAATNHGPGATGALATTLSPTYVFPVAGGPRSFILEAQKAGTGTVRAYDGVLTAIFVPFGSGGAATLEGP